jgi:alkanesulfonate monooxygenase SsuD/methylene tetrahydromethanopterin reductase-like flavin-dependent oxidoreductase (luciferase family)
VSERKDPDAAPDRDVEEMERRSERLEEDIDEVRKDWESKKSDTSAPGAQPEDESEEDD